jgi:CheY-like chemotaxis protein
MGARAPRVLVVDDAPMNRELLCLQLRNAGVLALAAADGAEALAAAIGAEVDLVFMDCMMPVMDGREACMRLRAHEAAAGRARVPVIGLSAGAADDERARCLAAGMDAYYVKPLTAAAVRGVLADWLGWT